MDESAALGLLQHLSKDDLQHLLNNEDKLNDLIQDLQQVRSVHCDHDDIVARNKSIAVYNLSLQPKLDTLKTEVAALYETVNKLKIDLNAEKTKLDKVDSNQKLETLHAVLQTVVAESEELAEELANDFCDKKLTVEEFMLRYIPCRTVGNKRRIKVDKMAELLREGENPWSSVPGPSSSMPPYPTSMGAPVPGPAPYPSGSGFGMPMPSLYRP